MGGSNAMEAAPREEFTFAFDGAAVERHEVEVSLLAESLLALRSLAERSCKMYMAGMTISWLK
jgi:hypothetical protein